jgi:type IV pilus assembly protein PilQ
VETRDRTSAGHGRVANRSGAYLGGAGRWWLACGLAAALLACAPFSGAQTPDPAAATDGPPPDTFQQLTGLLGQLLRTREGADQQEAPPEPARAPLDDRTVTRNETGLLDVHVRDMEIGTLLEILSYQARRNIVTSTSVTGKVSANLYAVTLEEALEAILTPNKFAYCPSGNTVFVGTAEELAVLLPPPQTRVFSLRYIRPAEAAAAVKAVLSSGASVIEGGGDSKQAATDSGRMEMGPAGRDYLVVTDRPERLEAAARLLAEIDRRPPQVLIESTVLRATLNESNQFGINFTMLGGVDFQNVESLSNAAADLSTGQLPAAKFENTTFNVSTSFRGTEQGAGFHFGIIKNNVAAFIRALEEITDVVVVANPKVVALNRQEGEVIVGRRDGYLTTMVTQTAAIQKVEFLETGTQIKFRPLINDDGTVRLIVHPKDSNGGLTTANLPFEETTEAHADILVRDGDTVLIGGLFRERALNSRGQFPVLGDVPGLGLLFGSRNDQTVREEVIILLTVHILKHSEQEQALFRGLLEDIERVRVGMRRGLVGTGRERLAQAFYQDALRQLERGRPQLALLDVYMTLNNHPKHLGALQLRERLLGERLWDDEGGRMRTFIWELIRTPTPVPPPSWPVFERPQVEIAPGAARSSPEPRSAPSTADDSGEPGS